MMLLPAVVVLLCAKSRMAGIADACLRSVTAQKVE